MPTTIVNSDKILISLDNFFTGSDYNGNITSLGKGIGYIYIPYEDFTLTQIVFEYFIQSSISPNIFTVGIQGLDVNGFPNDIFETSGTWASPASGNGTAAANVTSYNMIKGVAKYIVIKNNSDSYTGTINMRLGSSVNQSYGTYPVAIKQVSGGPWTIPFSQMSQGFWLYSGSKYYGLTLATSATTSTTRSTPNEIGTTFQFPASHPTLTLKALQLHTTRPLAGTLFELRIRNAAGTLLRSVVFDGDFHTTSDTFSTANSPHFVLNTPIDFIPGIKYYIMLSGTSGTPPSMRVCVNYTAQLMTDVRNGIVANLVEFNGTTYTETTNTLVRGLLMFDTVKYDQIEPPPIYSKPGGFSQF